MQEILVAFERKIENYSGKFQVVVEVSYWHEEFIQGLQILIFLFLIEVFFFKYASSQGSLKILVFVF